MNQAFIAISLPTIYGIFAAILLLQHRAYFGTLTRQSGGHSNRKYSQIMVWQKFEMRKMILIYFLPKDFCANFADCVNKLCGRCNWNHTRHWAIPRKCIDWNDWFVPLHSSTRLLSSIISHPVPFTRHYDFFNIYFSTFSKAFIDFFHFQAFIRYSLTFKKLIFHLIFKNSLKLFFI